MVVRCVARILDTDIGKTLMDMEILKFLRARTSAGVIIGTNWACSQLLGYAITSQTVDSLSTVELLPGY